MGYFSGTLGRRAYAGRLLLGFVIWVIVGATLGAISDYVSRMGGLIENVLLPLTFAAFGVYLVALVAKRLRDAGLSPWLALVVFCFGPFGIGFLVAVPTKTA